VAGHLAGRDRVLHGLLTWGTTTIVGMLFLTSAAGALFGGAASFLGSATASMNRSQPGYSGSQYGQQSQGSALAPTGRDTQDAAAQPDNEQRARQAGDVAARRVSQAALWSFFVLLLSGVVAAYGARSAAHTDRPEDYGHSRPTTATT